MLSQSQEIGNFTFTPTDLPGVTLITPRVRGDERGFFLETYQKKTFSKAGITTDFAQDNHSQSKFGVLRGLHIQLPPAYQEKLIRVTSGDVLDVAVHVYPENSPNFGKMIAVRLSRDNRQMLHIGQSRYRSEPVLYAHGFYVASDDAEVLYKASQPYSPSDETGLYPFDNSIRNNVFINLNPAQMYQEGLINQRDINWPSLPKLAQQIWEHIPERRLVVSVKKRGK
jgi:dTDP-4-dehydrorhamnose 3,5-epimerase